VEGQLQALKADLQKEKNLRLSLFSYAKSLRKQLETIYKSRSWKIAAPYRVIARSVYGLLRGKKIGKERIPDWPPSIDELNKPKDVSDNVAISEKTPPDIRQQVPTGSLQNPIFVDQIFGLSNTKTKAAHEFQTSRMIKDPRVRRFPGFIRYQVQHLLLPVKRRLSGRNFQTFRAMLSWVKVKNSCDLSRQPIENESKNLEYMKDVPEKEIEYWHDKAIQFLSELEARQSSMIEESSFFSKATLPSSIANKNDDQSGEVEHAVSLEVNFHQGDNLEYWRVQAIQLHEELEYAKANPIK
jgi:hypothetical protein